MNTTIILINALIGALVGFGASRITTLGLWLAIIAGAIFGLLTSLFITAPAALGMNAYETIAAVIFGPVLGLLATLVVLRAFRND